MGKKLTEEMVIARTKISDLSKIKRLNCWGSELEDVTLLRRMPSVEVLSLSINKINTLVDFQFCQRLEELYIRQNDIRDVCQVMYLQCLPNLKNLWLGENPCANSEGYRLAVIRALPQLQKLDNVQVTPEEIREAQRNGKILVHPEDSQDESEEEYVQQTMPIQRSASRDHYSENENSPPHISPRRREESSPKKQEVQRRTYSPEQEYVERRSVAYDRESPRQQQYYDEYTNGNGERYSYHSGSEYCVTQVPADRARDRERYTCPAAHRSHFTRRPVTRNSNILSAVLCLVKELDYPSLEVVEMAVRCRMDEMAE
ncbi:cilia- and flagella-associated protein 410 isoform X4 [Diabrotica virgifera virgifera]|uniref:Cilia- and flagella-associated protein 410 isoform X6 n=1 Tax=Diabrotica virgifera virgifera TaxID=50390 RepID=A0A6P7G4J3_DIAVI|nr:cilia- and flagella-associated protein 410 isoform X4 [Diabrotica virgifera virgifera]